MSDGAPRRFILALEGPSDLPRVQSLVDHFLEKHAGGATPLNELRRFEGIEGEPYVKISTIPVLARARKLQNRYSSGGPKKGDGGTLRTLWQVLHKDRRLASDVVILWVRDDDGYSERRAEAEDGRASLPDPARIRLGIASECGEAWVIAGFRPMTPEAKAKLAEWRKKLGFAPHMEPHRLSHEENAPKSAKRVHEDLFERDQEQQTAALLLAAEAGDQASSSCGLAAFCEEIEEHLSSTRGDQRGH